MPTGYQRLSNGSYRQTGPLQNRPYALNTDGCNNGSSACCFFRGYTPSCVGWELSGSQDFGTAPIECSCHDGTIYLPWGECTDPTWIEGERNECLYWQPFNCLTPGGGYAQFGCLGNLTGVVAGGLGVRIACISGVSGGGNPTVWVHSGRGVQGPTEQGYKTLYEKQLSSGNWPLCPDFDLTLDRHATAPTWLPATCRVFGAHGTPATDLEDLLQNNDMHLWRFCDDCGAVPDQYEAELSGFSCTPLNGTWTLTKYLLSGCADEPYWCYASIDVSSCGLGTAGFCIDYGSITLGTPFINFYVTQYPGCPSASGCQVTQLSRWKANIPSADCDGFSNLSLTYQSGLWSGASVVLNPIIGTGTP